MSKITVKFAGASGLEPKQLDLPAVPRVGDHMTLDSETLYRVSRVHWSFTSKGFETIVLHLEQEQRPNEMAQSRSRMTQKLAKCGWIEEAYIKEYGPNEMGQRIKWTESGIEKMRTLHRLLKEPRLLSETGQLGYVGGDLEAIFGLIGDCIHEHGAAPETER